MLWSHAYSTSTARDDRVPGVRGTDCMEVGGRQGRNPLFGSSYAGRDENGAERRRAIRRLLTVCCKPALIRPRTPQRVRRPSVSAPRNCPTRTRGGDHQHRRCGANQHQHRACFAFRAHSVFAPGWTADRRSGQCHQLLTHGSASGRSLGASCSERCAWSTRPGDSAGQLYCSTNLDREPACRARTAPAAKTAALVSGQGLAAGSSQSVASAGTSR
jgi:hypothetical protein